MNRHQIVAEIKRIALDDGGQAPGLRAFSRTTGVRKSDWYPHIWLRWGDALVEAGYAPNLFQTKTSDEALIEKYIELARELGRFPIQGEIRRKAKTDQSFPHHGAFNRFGGKARLLSRGCRTLSKSHGIRGRPRALRRAGEYFGAGTEGKAGTRR